MLVWLLPNVIKKKPKLILKIKRLLNFHWNVQFSSPNSSFNTSLIPFLSSLPRILRPSDAFLQIWLSKLNGNIFEIFANVFLCCVILTCLWKNMPKTSSLKTFFQPKKFTTYNKFNVVIMTLILKPSSLIEVMNFSLKPHLSNKSVKFLTKACPIVSLASNKPIVTYFGCQSLPKKLMINVNTS